MRKAKRVTLSEIREHIREIVVATIGCTRETDTDETSH
jgi:hypothetical protein